MTYDTQNIFAKILRGQIPCKKVFENEHALAFHDIAPHAPTHILVIPKGSYVSFSDFAEKATPLEMTGFWQAVGHVAKISGATEQGYRLIANTGLNGGQEVPHFHVHVLAGRKLGPMLSKAA